jgi:hypothetical protein
MRASGDVEVPVRHGLADIERRQPTLPFSNQLAVVPARLGADREVIVGDIEGEQLCCRLRATHLLDQVEETSPIVAPLELLRLRCPPVGDEIFVGSGYHCGHRVESDLVGNFLHHPVGGGISVVLIGANLVGILLGRVGEDPIVDEDRLPQCPPAAGRPTALSHRRDRRRLPHAVSTPRRTPR